MCEKRVLKRLHLFSFSKTFPCNHIVDLDVRNPDVLNVHPDVLNALGLTGVPNQELVFPSEVQPEIRQAGETASFNTTHQTIVVRVPSFASTFCICCSVAPKVTTTGLFAWKKKMVSIGKYKKKKSLVFVETGLPCREGCVIFATLW